LNFISAARFFYNAFGVMASATTNLDVLATLADKRDPKA
jgi:hypothetical protein